MGLDYLDATLMVLVPRQREGVLYGKINREEG